MLFVSTLNVREKWNNFAEETGSYNIFEFAKTNTRCESLVPASLLLTQIFATVLFVFVYVMSLTDTLFSIDMHCKHQNIMFLLIVKNVLLVIPSLKFMEDVLAWIVVLVRMQRSYSTQGWLIDIQWGQSHGGNCLSQWEERKVYIENAWKMVDQWKSPSKCNNLIESTLVISYFFRRRSRGRRRG